MCHLKVRLASKPQIWGFSRVFFQTAIFLVLIRSCRGQSEVFGSSQPIAATLGDDIILPCHLQPAVDALDMTVEWTRPDPETRYVYVWRDRGELQIIKHPTYKGRTSLFVNELKHGNISLKLSKVKLSDEGTYRCFVPELARDSTVQLVVGAFSSPGINLTGLDESSSGVVLQCESKGWYPEPEVLWLDGEGNVLSAGPTETVRGPDDLYTVSSRVTVDKRHGHRFTCRVQQNIINQTRETHIDVPDDFFKVQSRCSATTVGLAVSLVVCIMLILLLLLVLWKKKNMSKRNLMDEVESKDKNNDNAETELLAEDKKETKQTGRHQAAASWSSSSLLEGKLTKTTNELQEEKKKRQEEVKTLENQLKELRENKESVDKKLMETSEELKQTQDQLRVKTEEFNKLQDEKQSGKKREDNLQKELEDKEKKWENQLHDEKQRGKKTEDALKKELEDKNKKLDEKKQLKEKLKDLENKNTEVSDDKNELGEEEKKQEKDLVNNNTQLEEPTSSARTSGD